MNQINYLTMYPLKIFKDNKKNPAPNKIKFTMFDIEPRDHISCLICKQENITNIEKKNQSVE